MVEPDQPGETPNEPDDDAQSGGREQDDQHADDGLSDRERQLSAEARRYRLERNELRSKVKTYEDRDKTEEQRRADELAAANRRAEEAETRLLRVEIAAKYGIDSDDAKRLQGDTREALEADAKAFAKRHGLDSPNGGGTDFSSGVRRPVQRPKTMNEVIRQASGR